MPQPIDRRNVLLGTLAGVCVGAGAGLAVGRVSNAELPPEKPVTILPPQTDPFARQFYAQQGEDVVIANLFEWLRIAKPTYIDIGAYHPIVGNNTYLLYRAGSRGVLVEPNPALTPKLRQMRPGDTVLEIGIGPNAEDEEADYYLIKGNGQLNTFSKEEVASIVAREDESWVTGVIKRKLVNINKVLAENFPKGGPDLMSVDTEGLDLSILRSLDFTRFRPRVVVAETSEERFGISKEILDLMASKNYSIRGGSFVNTVFLDDEYVAAILRRTSPRDAAADR